MLTVLWHLFLALAKGRVILKHLFLQLSEQRCQAKVIDELFTCYLGGIDFIFIDFVTC
jgi:hypothetical protein